MRINVTNGVKITGNVRVLSFRGGFCDAVEPIDRAITHEKRLLMRETNPCIRDLITERIEHMKEGREAIRNAFFIRIEAQNSNLVMDSADHGLDIIIQRLAGTTTYSGILTYIEIGTGTTTPAVNDTALTTPVARAAVSYSEDFGNTNAIVQAYIADANLTNQTYHEIGAFIDGSATIGSGQIFNRALLSTSFVKTSGQDTTLEVDINIVNS